MKRNDHECKVEVGNIDEPPESSWPCRTSLHSGSCGVKVNSAGDSAVAYTVQLASIISVLRSSRSALPG